MPEHGDGDEHCPLDCAECKISRLRRLLDEPGPNVEGCFCDRDDPAASLCALHESRLAPLSRRSLVFRFVESEAWEAAITKELRDD